jgi:hypothetical protein
MPLYFNINGLKPNGSSPKTSFSLSQTVCLVSLWGPHFGNKVFSLSLSPSYSLCRQCWRQYGGASPERASAQSTRPGRGLCMEAVWCRVSMSESMWLAVGQRLVEVNHILHLRYLPRTVRHCTRGAGRSDSERQSALGRTSKGVPERVWKSTEGHFRDKQSDSHKKDTDSRRQTKEIQETKIRISEKPTMVGSEIRILVSCKETSQPHAPSAQQPTTQYINTHFLARSLTRPLPYARTNERSPAHKRTGTRAREHRHARHQPEQA